MNWPTLICGELLGGTPERPVLLGGRCQNCGELSFPIARTCTRCTGSGIAPQELGSTGRIWSWTVQMFQPKYPYDGGAHTEAFSPYPLGYVVLDCGLKVESRLVAPGDLEPWIGQPVQLVLEPYRITSSGEQVFTYAFGGVS